MRKEIPNEKMREPRKARKNNNPSAGHDLI
jgi:hypothetical protein